MALPDLFWVKSYGTDEVFFFSEVNCRGRFNTIASILPSHYRKIGEEKNTEGHMKFRTQHDNCRTAAQHPSRQ